MLTCNIIIPVLNEEKRLERGIAETVLFLEERNLLNNFHITIANNGSIDETEKVAENLVKRYSNVSYLNVGRRGVGLALKTAWRASKSDIVGYMDVDLATDLRHVVEMFNVFANSPDVVAFNGSRNLKASVVSGRTFKRSVISHLFNFILKKMLTRNISDGMCGFKFFRKDAILDVISKNKTDDNWFFCAEILVLIERNSGRIYECPVRWHDDRDSRVRIIKTSIDYLIKMFSLRQSRN